MPEVLEETERERRLREKEEALIAAQQAAQIQDAYPIEPPVMPAEAAQWATPVNTFTGPDLEALRQANPSAAAQYDAQVAQAQRNNGFINSEVNFEGRVLSPMINPELSPQAAAIAEIRARQFTGQQKYRKLIEGGAMPEEAMRLAGPDLFYNNTKGLLASIKGAGPRRASVEPVIRTSGGRQFYQTPTGGWAPLTEKAVKFQGGSISPDVSHERDQLEKEATELRADLRKGTKKMWVKADPANGIPESKLTEVELNAEQKKALKEQIDALKLSARELTHPGGHLREEMNPRIDQNSFSRERWDNPQMPQSLRAAPVPVITEQIPGGGFRIGTQTETAAAPEAGAVIKYDKSGKAWVVDERTKKVLRPAN